MNKEGYFIDDTEMELKIDTLDLGPFTSKPEE